MPKTELQIVAKLDLGNSLARLGKFEEAIGQYTTALQEIAQSPEKDKLDVLAAQISTVLAEELCKLGRMDKSLEALSSAISYYGLLPPAHQPIPFHLKAAAILHTAGKSDVALKHLESARESLFSQLTGTPDISIWESMLNNWSTLQALAVRIAADRQKPDEVRQALVEAEAAKGRLMAWLQRFGKPQAAQQALDLRRHEEALKAVEGWCAKETGQVVISLFATDEGLAVFTITANAIHCSWLYDAAYQEIVKDYYEPWEKLLDEADTAGGLLAPASAVTDLLLTRLGEWFWRAHPTLADGGKTLVIIPHRLFRSLPLGCSRLPGGKYLTDLFDEVFVVPTLHTFAEKLSDIVEMDISGGGALVDPDGTLPFARLEGRLSFERSRFQAGDEVTREKAIEAMGSERTLLLSCHGEFDEANPWQSFLVLSNGTLDLVELLGKRQSNARAAMVVLGSCEASRHRRSMSDEPLGFAGALVQSGISMVLAPLWKVDDLAACLFVTRFFELYRIGIAPAKAAQKSALELRSMSAREVMERLQDWLRRNALPPENGDHLVLTRLEVERIEIFTRWLKTLYHAERPYRSPYDWAAFQLLGFQPTIDSSSLTKKGE